jgi:hypothetical protein
LAQAVVGALEEDAAFGFRICIEQLLLWEPAHRAELLRSLALATAAATTGDEQSGPDAQ